MLQTAAHVHVAPTNTVEAPHGLHLNPSDVRDSCCDQPGDSLNNNTPSTPTKSVEQLDGASSRVVLSLDACLADNMPFLKVQHTFPEALCWTHDDWATTIRDTEVQLAALPEGLHVHPATYFALAEPHQFPESPSPIPPCCM